METKKKKPIYKQTVKDAALAMELKTIILYDANKPRITLEQLFANNKLTRFVIERRYLGNVSKYNKKTGATVQVEQYSKPIRIIAEFENNIHFIVSGNVFKHYQDNVDVDYKNVR